MRGRMLVFNLKKEYNWNSRMRGNLLTAIYMTA